MLVIRFFRAGKKNQPLYKIVVTDKRKSSVKGTYVEEVGFFDPLKDKKTLRAERIKYWISVGAKPSPTVHNLLVTEKIIEGKKINKFKKSKKKDEKKAEVPAAAAAAAPAAPVASQPVAKEIKPAEAAPKKKEEKALATPKAPETSKKAEASPSAKASEDKPKVPKEKPKIPETK